MDDIQTITEGVAVKIQQVFGPILDTAVINTDILYAPDEVAMRSRADATAGSNRPEKQDKTKYQLEFISFWLDTAEFSWDRNRTPLARQGLNVGTSTAPRYVKAAPIDLDFTISLWTLQKSRADEFIKEYCFLQLNNPKLDITWMGTIPLPYQFFIRPMIRQDDTVRKMYVEGKYWKPQISFHVEGWLLKDVPVGIAKTVNLLGYINENLGVVDVNTLAFEHTAHQ